MACADRRDAFATGVESQMLGVFTYLPLLRESAHARHPAGPRHLSFVRRCLGSQMTRHQADEGVSQATRNPVFPLELSGLLAVRAATR